MVTSFPNLGPFDKWRISVQHLKDDRLSNARGSCILKSSQFNEAKAHNINFSIWKWGYLWVKVALDPYDQIPSHLKGHSGQNTW